MFKRLMFFISILVLIVCVSLAFAKDKKMSQTGKLEKLAEGSYVYVENEIQHNISVKTLFGEMDEVIDTLRWYSTGDEGFVNNTLGQYLYPNDTVFLSLKLIPDPARLLKVRGLFNVGGQSEFLVWKGADEGASRLIGDTLLTRTWQVTGDQNLVNWDEIDVSTANLELPYSPDPDPLNRPWFQVGYVCSGTGANPGDGVPHIMFDFNTVMVYFTGSNANRYSWFTYNGVGYYGLRYPDANPITWAQWEMEAVVNYYNGTSPFINSLTQLNDTWTTSGFKSVGAELVDMDGTITTALLYFQKNAGTPDSVTASSITLDMYYFDIPGTYTAGDSITYWVKVRDNEGKSIIGSRKYFKVFAPMNADSPILVVFNGLTSSESDLALFWEPLLNNVVVDSLGMTYEYWDIEKHNGIDASIINYPSFKHALVFGYGVNNVPVTNYSGTEWGDFVSAGKNIMLASADYLYANGFSGNLTFGSGEFINDVFGVGHAESDPNDGVNSTGDEFIIGVASDPISGPWAGVPIILNFSAVLGGSNWGDFARADTANLAKAETIFTGVASDSGNGVRNISGYGGAGVYLPFCFSAIADTTPTGDPVVQDAAKSLLLRILEWFESVTSIDGNMTTQINNYELKANYPNPFNPGTTIEYTLKERSQVSLVIYNALGERVRTLVNDVQAADKYQVRWDGRNEQGIHVASGIYIYKLTAGDFVSARKMILMK